MQRKTTWMRFLVIGINLILFFTLFGCSKVDPLKTINYIYINESGKDLTIEVYNELDVNFISYNLNNEDRIETHTSRSEVPAIFFYDNTDNEIGVRVVIRFPDNKCLYYSYSERDGVFNVQKYSKKLLDQSGDRYTLYYTISEQDYNQAVDCE